MRRLSRVLILAAPLLSSCNLFLRGLGVPPPCQFVTVEVPDGPRVVDGLWTGKVEDYPSEGVDSELRMDLSASYLDERNYAVQGTFQLGADPSAPVEGTVRGGCFENYVPSAVPASGLASSDALAPADHPPPVGFDARVLGSGATELWTLRGDVFVYRDEAGESRHVIHLEIERQATLEPFVRFVQLSEGTQP